MRGKAIENSRIKLNASGDTEYNIPNIPPQASSMLVQVMAGSNGLEDTKKVIRWTEEENGAAYSDGFFAEHLQYFEVYGQENMNNFRFASADTNEHHIIVAFYE